MQCYRLHTWPQRSEDSESVIVVDYWRLFKFHWVVKCDVVSYTDVTFGLSRNLPRKDCVTSQTNSVEG